MMASSLMCVPCVLDVFRVRAWEANQETRLDEFLPVGIKKNARTSF